MNRLIRVRRLIHRSLSIINETRMGTGAFHDCWVQRTVFGTDRNAPSHWWLIHAYLAILSTFFRKKGDIGVTSVPSRRTKVFAFPLPESSSRYLTLWYKMSLPLWAIGIMKIRAGIEKSSHSWVGTFWRRLLGHLYLIIKITRDLAQAFIKKVLTSQPVVSA